MTPCDPADSGSAAEYQKKHGVAFAKARFSFADPRRVIAEDPQPK
jgi:uncharacterized DUF497 family protein